MGAAARNDYFETNVGGTENLLRFARRCGVGQLVYASSLAVYGPVRKASASTRTRPSTIIRTARSLLGIEDCGRPHGQFVRHEDRTARGHRARAFLRARPPLPIGIFAFRLGNIDVVFGDPAEPLPLNYVENLIDAMQAAAMCDSELPQWNPGANVLDGMHAVVASACGLREFNVLDNDDLTLGQYNRLKRAADGSTTYFASGWPLYAASPFAEALRGIIPMGDTRLSRHQLQRSLQDRRYDTSRIRRETGWKPRVSLADGIQRTLNGTRPFAPPGPGVHRK